MGGIFYETGKSISDDKDTFDFLSYDRNFVIDPGIPFV